ncbi:uncharacterized protein LOC126846869 isoform X3 [Adelges cooleyi]|uniref:uncharacterized protein LOC126846869 isoform X3 n=1 Tax=Adelges cooleyi TaxID=133065 RepID=UPI00217FC358|nr:uncharacterized protein LOC126846869 isoform X3 [Adelges cooleyi]
MVRLKCFVTLILIVCTASISSSANKCSFGACFKGKRKAVQDEPVALIEEKRTSDEIMNVEGPPKTNYDILFLQFLNSLKTSESASIEFTDGELVYLSKNRQILDTDDLKNKLNIKIQSLKCVYGYIIHKSLIDLKSLIDKSTAGRKDAMGIVNDSEDVNIIKAKVLVRNLKNYISRMLSMLYIGRAVAANWLWNVYMKLSAIDYQSIPLIELFRDKTSLEQMSNFVEMCNRHGYMQFFEMPKEILGQDQYFSRNVVKLLVDVKLLEDQSSNKCYDFSGHFSTSNIFLTQLKGNANMIIPELPEMTTIRDEYNVKLYYSQFIPHQESHSSHFQLGYYYGLLKRMMTTALYDCVWTHLLSYSRNTYKTKEPLSEDQKKISRKYLRLLLNSIEEAVDFLDMHGNEYFKSLISDLKNKKHLDTKSLDKYIKDAQNKVFYNLISMGATVNPQNWTKFKTPSLFGVKLINLQYLPNERLGINKFNYYIESIKKSIAPIKFRMLNFFITSKSENWLDQFGKLRENQLYLNKTPFNHITISGEKKRKELSNFPVTYEKREDVKPIINVLGEATNKTDNKNVLNLKESTSLNKTNFESIEKNKPKGAYQPKKVSKIMFISDLQSKKHEKYSNKIGISQEERNDLSGTNKNNSSNEKENHSKLNNAINENYKKENLKTEKYGHDVPINNKSGINKPIPQNNIEIKKESKEDNETNETNNGLSLDRMPGSINGNENQKIQKKVRFKDGTKNDVPWGTMGGIFNENKKIQNEVELKEESKEDNKINRTKHSVPWGKMAGLFNGNKNQKMQNEVELKEESKEDDKINKTKNSVPWGIMAGLFNGNKN